MRVAKPVLMVAGTAIGMFGLGAVVFAAVFQKIERQYRR